MSNEKCREFKMVCVFLQESDEEKGERNSKENCKNDANRKRKRSKWFRFVNEWTLLIHSIFIFFFFNFYYFMLKINKKISFLTKRGFLSFNFVRSEDWNVSHWIVCFDFVRCLLARSTYHSVQDGAIQCCSQRIFLWFVMRKCFLSIWVKSLFFYLPQAHFWTKMVHRSRGTPEKTMPAIVCIWSKFCSDTRQMQTK